MRLPQNLQAGLSCRAHLYRRKMQRTRYCTAPDICLSGRSRRGKCDRHPQGTGLCDCPELRRYHIRSAKGMTRSASWVFPFRTTPEINFRGGSACNRLRIYGARLPRSPRSSASVGQHGTRPLRSVHGISCGTELPRHPDEGNFHGRTMKAAQTCRIAV